MNVLAKKTPHVYLNSFWLTNNGNMIISNPAGGFFMLPSVSEPLLFLGLDKCGLPHPPLPHQNSKEYTNLLNENCISYSGCTMKAVPSIQNGKWKFKWLYDPKHSCVLISCHLVEVDSYFEWNLWHGYHVYGIPLQKN